MAAFCNSLEACSGPGRHLREPITTATDTTGDRCGWKEPVAAQILPLLSRETPNGGKGKKKWGSKAWPVSSEVRRLKNPLLQLDGPRPIVTRPSRQHSTLMDDIFLVAELMQPSKGPEAVSIDHYHCSKEVQSGALSPLAASFIRLVLAILRHTLLHSHFPM
ncbi:hypothetical protein QBC45DRAFT_201751 [Copromyces sp. CBS 386.78]|nr:hypothetical protein QBC45DRAFT_201751 [Copromyces sp. CBS 386.78]